MSEQRTSSCPVRLCALSMPAKLMLTFFLLLVGAGYCVALANIYLQHQDADLTPGLSPDDLRRVYHGLKKQVTAETIIPTESEMLHEVRPGGRMRKHLEEGGPASIRALIGWLEDGAKEAEFTKENRILPGDPSAKETIAQCCSRCHNAMNGEASEVPYAPDPQSDPQYALVAKMAAPPTPKIEKHQEMLDLAPTDLKELVLTTHLHILSIPVFTLIVGGLFLLTGLRPGIKLVLGPLPMLAVIGDIGGWWLARFFEPGIHLIAAAGAVFGAALGLQILCVAGSIWLGRKPDQR